MPSLKQPVRRRPPRRVLSRALPSVAAAALVLGCHDAPTTGPLPGDGLLEPHARVVLGSAPVVNSLADPGDGICDVTQCTLREAIAAAQPGDQITFAIPASDQDRNIFLGPTLVMDKDLTVTGPVSPRVWLTGDFTRGVLGVNAGVRVTVRRLSIVSGLTRDDVGGSAVLNDGILTLEDCEIRGNLDDRDSPAIPGAIVNRGVLTVRRCDVNDNVSPTAIRDMTANTLTIENTAMVSNVHRAIYAPSAHLVLINSTISTRRVTASAGPPANVIHAATAVIRNSTTVNNQATDAVMSIPGGLTISSSILVNGTSRNCSASTVVTSQGYNIFASSDDDCGPGPLDQSLAPDDLFTRVLGPLEANGGPTRTHAVRDPALTGYTNPALDQGSCAAAALTTDQRGMGRPVDFLAVADAADGCDVGAFELQPRPPCTLSDLVARVEVLQTVSVLNKGQAKGLLGKLDQVAKLLDRDKTDDARTVLSDFRVQVSGLLADGVLSSAQAADLDQCAAEVDTGLVS